MRKFLIKSGIFIALIFAILGLAVLVTLKYLPVNTDNYNYEHIIKMHRLDTLASPRLIFIGGSNIAFGLNSARISDSLDINVQNAAVHAGIGLRYMLDEITVRVRKGDIVVVMPEYSQFDKIYNGDDAGTLTDVVVYGDGSGWSRLNSQQLLNVISGFPSHIKGRRRIDLDRAVRNNGYVYATRNFNEYGDEAAHRSRPPQKLSVSKYKLEIDMEIISEMAAKIKDIQAKGARVILLWPITIESNFNAGREALGDVADALGACGISFDSSPDYLVEPDSLAYDTPYHMSGPAVEDVTDKIIARLRVLIPADTIAGK